MDTRFSTFHFLMALMGATLLPKFSASAQSPPDPDFVRESIFASYAEFKTELLATVSIADPAQRAAEIDAFWSTLRNAGQVPYAQDSQVAFLHRGAASSVAWPGDFNGWNPAAASWQGTPLAGTDLWILEKSFPSDARLDYKIVRNGSWILDPANPLQMWGGFGPNSELRMPDYVFPPETVRQPGRARGNLTANITTASNHLGYSVNYQVYTPAGYDGQHDHAQMWANLPVVYVTDGHEYSADHLGSMVVVLDNLIDSGALQPTIAVFIDPRDPSTGANRRASEYTGNPAFASFVADELVAEIDGAYRTLDAAAGRTILATSYGGVNSAYFGATRSDVFENIAVQSPANFSPIFALYASQALQDKVDFAVTAGTIGDGSGGTNLTSVLAANGYDFRFTQVNEGHSWGNWRALLDEVLIDLVGPTAILGADFNGDGLVDAADFASWRGGFGIASGASHANGDADSNRRVDGADFLAWQRQSGAGAAPLASPLSVPEPSATLWLLTCAALVLSRQGVRKLPTRRVRVQELPQSLGLL